MTTGENSARCANAIDPLPAVLALASGATLPEAALVGNLTASVTIQQLATTGTATPDQLLQQLHLRHEGNI